MENRDYQVLHYEETADGVKVTILVLSDGEPKAVYHVPSFGFDLPPPEAWEVSSPTEFLANTKPVESKLDPPSPIKGEADDKY